MRFDSGGDLKSQMGIDRATNPLSQATQASCEAAYIHADIYVISLFSVIRQDKSRDYRG